MKDAPHVNLTIDYEPWFALTRRYDQIENADERRSLDNGFTEYAIDPILSMLDGVSASFYLVGEIAEWYPLVPEKIVNAGHELGFHCQNHRSLTDPNELRKDLNNSREWRQKYSVVGYRAPMVGISEEGYELLKREGFEYSSSIYAPTGKIQDKNGIWEVPVSTQPYTKKQRTYSAPRPFNSKLLVAGEIPYGSSFMIGLTPLSILKRIDAELRDGKSPVIILHPYELVRPVNFIRNMLPDLIRSPQLLPFMIDKSHFLKQLIKNFPIGTIREQVRIIP